MMVEAKKFFTFLEIAHVLMNTGFIFQQDYELNYSKILKTYSMIFFIDSLYVLMYLISGHLIAH